MCSLFLLLDAAMLILILALLADPVITRPTVDPAKLTLAQAAAIAGTEVLVTAPAVGPQEGTFDGWDVYDLAGPGETWRTIFVPEGTDPAKLRDAVCAVEVVTHRAWVRWDGERIPARTEVRVRVVR